MTDNTARKLVPIPEARAQLGGVSHATIYRWARRGQINFVRIGGRTFVSAEEIARLSRGDAPAKAAA